MFVCAGMSLLRCGEAQKQLGEAEKKFVQSTDIHFLSPLRSFSDGQYRVLQVHTYTTTVQNLLLLLHLGSSRRGFSIVVCG